MTGPGARVTAVPPVTGLLREPGGPELVTQARLGDAAEVLSLSPAAGEWLSVRLRHSGDEGWARADAFAPGAWPPEGAAVWRVRSLFANVHDGPSVRARLLFAATLGAPVIPFPESGQDGGGAGWRRVGLPGDRTGWLLAGDCCPHALEWTWQTPDDLRAGLVRTAIRLLGLPYRWGGNTPHGLDCSGLVQLAYRLHGVDLPHNAKRQAEDQRTTPVTRDALSAGDLLFFAGYTHVGLAVSPLEFIHATTHGQPGVQLSRLADPHWSARLDECRKFRPEECSIV